MYQKDKNFDFAVPINQEFNRVNQKSTQQPINVTFDFDLPNSHDVNNSFGLRLLSNRQKKQDN